MHQSDRVILFLFLFSLLFFGYQEINAGTITSISDSTLAVTVSENSHFESDLPSVFMVIPFVILLGMIATGPLFYHHFWEKNYPIISVILGLITVFYYLIFLNDTHSLLHTAAEYLSFIALLSSLFVASGGILIRVDKKSTPWLNAGILLFGSVIANVIGTTGASMLLIRPFIKINKDRIKPYHIVFFIFLVSNIGGALTPIGDPPLFLGFLRGVEFFWVIGHVWYIWLPTILLITLIFVLIDSRNVSKDEKVEKFSGKIEFKGMKNVFYLLVIVISVFIDPAVISWIPSLSPLPFGIREIIMFSMVVIAYRTADEDILKANEFNFEPIKEVAYLFVGIFATMIPALQLISHEANVLGEKLTPGIFYWATGVLSSFLDNAPTYLNFLSAALGKYGMNVNLASDVSGFAQLHPIYLAAISVAAVFFGAMTYIGNGPNFMVKSISERSGIKMPSFFGFMIKYSIPVLIPIFTIVWLVFYF
ncbi:MAG: sodium:proton antiporter [Ignavibacteriaceae bacterium]|jgi:Na+/H+ antiporter NhaD/arsenite permease-like protein|nr:sodium:proton antiporter [Ignavibacteriaceae bacterium]